MAENCGLHSSLHLNGKYGKNYSKIPHHTESPESMSTTLNLSLEPLPLHDQNLMSPHSNTAQSIIGVARKRGMINKYKRSGWINKFSSSA